MIRALARPRVQEPVEENLYPQEYDEEFDGADLDAELEGEAAEGDAEDEGHEGEIEVLDDEVPEDTTFASAVWKLAPAPDFEAAAREAAAAVDHCVKKVFGHEAFVLPYGSLVQGVHLDGSDVDLCLDLGGAVTSSGKDNSSQVNALKRLMSNLPSSFRVTETRFWKHIKVPILIVRYTSCSNQEVEADISVGIEHEGVDKSFTDRLVRRVLSRCPKALHAARAVKLWAKAEKLNKAFEGQLNSLGWTLLVLYYFFEQAEVDSEVLNEEAPDERGLEGENSLPPPLHTGEEDEELADPDMQYNDVPSPMVLAEFFEWVVSTATSWPEEDAEGACGLSLIDVSMIKVPAATKQWADQTSFFIEDPGIRLTKGTSENVARALKSRPWRVSLDRCKAAAATLRSDDPADADAWMIKLLQGAAAVRKEAEAAKRNVPLQGVKRPWAAMGAAQQGGRAPPPPPPPPPAQRLEPYIAGKAAEGKGTIPRMSNGGKGKGGFEGPPQKRAKSGGLCKWFLLNECWSGDRCRYSHGEGYPSTGQGASKGKNGGTKGKGASKGTVNVEAEADVDFEAADCEGEAEFEADVEGLEGDEFGGEAEVEEDVYEEEGDTEL